ncbi:CASH domain-dontaining protein [Methanophagales archaeon]|nr:CASH domain-dontaining protein [Methanophagales archaeon]
MNKLILAFLIAAFLLVLPVQATIYVGGEDGLATISEAIKKANENETIIVCEGIYSENVVIDKPLILKTAGNVTIEAAESNKDVVSIKASNVVFSGFNVKCGYVGIHLDKLQGCEIENNSVFGNDIGISLNTSSGNGIVNNAAFKNEITGIQLDSSNNNRIENNTALDNYGGEGNGGIRLASSNNNTVNNNNASNNFNNGIFLYSSSNNTIGNNIALNNSYGIWLRNSSRNDLFNNIFNKNSDGSVLIGSNSNEIINNTACENGNSGLSIQEGSSTNDVCSNIFNKNLYGIFLSGSNTNEIINNTVCENGDRGLTIQRSSKGNDICSNIFNKNLHGLYLFESDTNKITNNIACENGCWGLTIQYNSSGNDVCNNFFNKNLHGIFLRGSSTTKITNNTACENGNIGLKIECSSRNEVRNNIFNKNLHGIWLIGSNSNEITNNTACENGYNGLIIQESSENDVCNNMVNKNLYGIGLLDSNTNEITNNTAYVNGDTGLKIQFSSGNDVCDNRFNKNWGDGIGLLDSNSNEILNNNIEDNRNQIYIENSTLNDFNYNYWSDYKGEDKNRDGIGDEPYGIEGIEQENDYDSHPYMSYSGWRNVVITPEFWEFFTEAGAVNYFTKNFSIENRFNRATNVEILLDEYLGFEACPNGCETKNKTISIEPKSTKTITLRLNVTNLESYILRKIAFKTEEYTKTTLVNGFVQPKIHTVKIEGVDFHRNVVKGQINPFNVILHNYGDNDEFFVKMKMEREEKSSTVYLNENETRTVQFDIGTFNLPLGINKGEIVVSKDEQLDYLNLTLFVASKLEASTLIVTNFSRFNESKDLRHELISLTHHPAVNGILLDVKCNYSEFDSNYKANELCEAIMNQIEAVINEYPNIKYLIIVGDDRVIPFYRVWDGTSEVFTRETGLPDESEYYKSDHYPNPVSESIDDALSSNHFLTDDFYSRLEGDRVLAVGRLVEKPDEIIRAIDMFFNYYQLTPTDVFVTGYDFMYDGGEECYQEWGKRIEIATDKSKRINTTFKYRYKKGSNYGQPHEIIDKICNSSVAAIFLHANYDQFEVPPGEGGGEMGYLEAEELKTLNGSVIYSIGCHAGLTIPNVIDLPQSFLSHGTIAYIAPTGYGLGGIITVAGHEKLLKYLTKRIAGGEEIGFALMNAKNDYYLDNFNQDTLDDKVMKSLTLYGFPMYAVRLDSLSITALSNDLEEQSTTDLAYSASSITLEVATLTLKPSFKIYETENGTYYSYESYTTEAGMPILPKATWYFIRSDKEIRSIVLHSARFDVNDTRLAIETFAVSDGTGSVNALKGWYPTIPFTLNTIEDRQNIVIASAQYKKKAVWSKEGTIRLFNEIVLDIFRVPVDAEKEKPMVDVSIDNGIVTVKAEDNAGIYDVFVTYLDAGNNSWVSTSLGHGDRGRESVEYNVHLNNTVFFVQAIDANGNVKIDDNKGAYYMC